MFILHNWVQVLKKKMVQPIAHACRFANMFLSYLIFQIYPFVVCDIN